jgi:Reverse transcriptase (RNA-dependent DNA polymerase)
LKYGVPQGSVLGPVLFIMYTYPLSDVIKPFGISYHFFADDSQLYDSAVPTEVPRLAANVSVAVAIVYTWMGENKLKMNEDKTLTLGDSDRNQKSIVESWGCRLTHCYGLLGPTC